MDDQRKMQRFEIAMPAQVTMNGGTSQDKAIEVTSHNICADGAYFIAPNSVEVGTPVEVKMRIGSKIGSDAVNRYARVVVTGIVLRIEADGWVVKFNRHFKMSREQ